MITLPCVAGGDCCLTVLCKNLFSKDVLIDTFLELKTLQITEKEAWDLAFNALVNNQTSEDNAKEVADALVSAEFDGQAGHGLSRIPSYVEQLTAGKVKGTEAPSVISSKGSVVRVDAKNGFAYPAISLALKEIKTACKKFGIAAASISRSHHFGQAGRHVEALAESGLIALINLLVSVPL